MRIAVLVKQIPHPESIEFDPEEKTLKREGVPLVLNPFDEWALAHAVGLRKRHGGEVVAVTMGPPQAAEALEQALALGADRAVHLSDRLFAVADTLATARTLALALEREQPDLVVCGRKTADSETWQVPPQVAAFLGLPHLTSATALEVAAPGALHVLRETDEGEELHEVTLPAVVSVARPAAAAPGGAASGGIATLGADDLVDDPQRPEDPRFGQRGSPTRVLAVRDVTPERDGLRAADAAEAASLVRRKLEALEPPVVAWEKPPHAAEQPGASYDAWTWVELTRGRPTRHSLELLARSRELAGKLGGRNVALVLGEAPELGLHGADAVVAVEGDFGAFVPEAWAAAVRTAVEAERPHVVLFPASANGRDLAARVAGELRLGMTGDCVNVDVAKAGRLLQTKPAYGGNIVGVIMSATTPQLATVRSRMFEPLAPRPGEQAETRRVAFDPPAARTRLLERRAPSNGHAVESAQVVLLLGEEVLTMDEAAAVQRAADEIPGAAVAGTREACAAGLVPWNRQVGLHGRAVAPRLLVAYGVRGDFEHLSGFVKAGVVLAVHSDPDAPVLGRADVAVVGDWRPLAQELHERLRAHV